MIDCDWYFHCDQGLSESSGSPVLDATPGWKYPRRPALVLQTDLRIQSKIRCGKAMECNRSLCTDPAHAIWKANTNELLIEITSERDRKQKLQSLVCWNDQTEFREKNEWEKIYCCYLGIRTPGLHLISSSPKNSEPRMYCNGSLRERLRTDLSSSAFSSMPF